MHSTYCIIIILKHTINFNPTCILTLHYAYTDPAEILKSNHEKLVNGIQNADELASSLYTSEIIAPNIRDKVFAADGKDKNKVLLEAIQSSVSISPRTYEVFRNDVLKEQPLFQDLLPSLSATDMY